MDKIEFYLRFSLLLLRCGSCQLKWLGSIAAASLFVLLCIKQCSRGDSARRFVEFEDIVYLANISILKNQFSLFKVILRWFDLGKIEILQNFVNIFFWTIW